MATFEKNQGDMHRFYAYTKAVNTLKNYRKKIESGAEARQLPGIGPRIAEKIDEILRTSELRQLEALKADERLAAVGLLARVPGIGPARAQRLVDEDGIRTIEELRRRAPGLGLNHYQQVGLRYFEELELKLPRREVEELGAVIRDEAHMLDPLYRLDSVGSYRRGLPQSGDIDMLLTHPNYTAARKQAKEGGYLAPLAARLQEVGIVTDVLGLGEAQFTAVCRLPLSASGGEAKPHRRLDIKLVPVESYPCALLHYTGSSEFNRQMRVIAQNKRLKLSEYALRPVAPDGAEGEPLPVLSEEDVFRALDIPYRSPSERSF
jgi:DNA polymerase beta